MFWIDHKLAEKLIEVSFNVDTLLLISQVVAHKHEVRVDFKSAIFSNHHAHLRVLLSGWIVFGD